MFKSKSVADSNYVVEYHTHTHLCTKKHIYVYKFYKFVSLKNICFHLASLIWVLTEEYSRVEIQDRKKRVTCFGKSLMVLKWIKTVRVMNIFWNSHVRNLGVEKTETKVTVGNPCSRYDVPPHRRWCRDWGTSLCEEETDHQNSLGLHSLVLRVPCLVPWSSCLLNGPRILDDLYGPRVLCSYVQHWRPWQLRNLNLGDSG